MSQELAVYAIEPRPGSPVQKNMICHCGKVHSNNYITKQLIVFSLNPNT